MLTSDKVTNNSRILKNIFWYTCDDIDCYSESITVTEFV